MAGSISIPVYGLPAPVWPGFDCARFSQCIAKIANLPNTGDESGNNV